MSGAFYPRTCHPPLSRRRFVAGGVAMAAALGLRPGPAAAGAADEASAIIRAYATALDDPWVIAHGIRGMGKDFALSGGRRAVDYLLETFVEQVTVGGKTYLRFPPKVERHENSFLKTMLEAGVPLDHEFEHGGRRRRLAELADGGRALFRPGSVAIRPDSTCWSLVAFSRTSLMRKRWVNAWGEQVDLDEVTDAVLGTLERASAACTEARRAGRPLAAQADVHGFTCGGTHMLYGLLSCVYHGFGGSGARQRVREQVALMAWRMKADVDLITRFYASRGSDGTFNWFETDSKLKLLGHAEECVTFAAVRGVAALTPEEQAPARAGAEMLKQILADLRQKNFTGARKLDVELYRQLVGDTCHARHGLTLA